MHIKYALKDLFKRNLIEDTEDRKKSLTKLKSVRPSTGKVINRDRSLSVTFQTKLYILTSFKMTMWHPFRISSNNTFFKKHERDVSTDWEVYMSRWP